MNRAWVIEAYAMEFYQIYHHDIGCMLLYLRHVINGQFTINSRESNVEK